MHLSDAVHISLLRLPCERSFDSDRRAVVQIQDMWICFRVFVCFIKNSFETLLFPLFLTQILNCNCVIF